MPGDDALRALAREILERHEYARWRPLDSETLRGLLDRMTRFVDWMGELSQTQPLLWAAILGGLLLVALLLLAHVVIALRSALAAPGPAVSPRASASGPQFLGEAQALARDGRYLEAARRLQLACLESLLSRGQLELQRFEANRTLRRRIAASELPPAQRSELLTLLQRLETRIFRDRTEDRGLYEAWLALHGRLAAAAPTAPSRRLAAGPTPTRSA